MRVPMVLICAVLTALSTARAQSSADLLAEGRRHITEGRLAEALAAFRSALAADSSNVATWRAMASALHRLERYPEALDAVDRARTLAPQDFAVRFNRALTLSELGRVSDAVAELDTAVSLRPGFAPAWTERGAAKALLGRTAEARADWDRALALDSTYIWSRYYRGLAAITAGNYGDAIADLDAVTAKEALLGAHLWRWVAYRLDGRAAPPLPAPATEWPAPIAAFLLGQATDQQLIALAGASRLPIDDRRLASAHFFIAQKHLAEGRRSAARAELERALAVAAPRHAEAVTADAQLRRLAR